MDPIFSEKQKLLAADAHKGCLEDDHPRGYLLSYPKS